MSLSEPFYGLEPDPAPELATIPDDLAEASREWLAKALEGERSRTEDLETKLDEVYAREKILVEGLSDEQGRRRKAEEALAEAEAPIGGKRAAIEYLAERYRDETENEARRWQYGLVLVHELGLENDGQLGKALEGLFGEETP